MGIGHTSCVCVRGLHFSHGRFLFWVEEKKLVGQDAAKILYSYAGHNTVTYGNSTQPPSTAELNTCIATTYRLTADTDLLVFHELQAVNDRFTSSA